MNITIRVYGLLFHENRILLSRERIKGSLYTKFPGGGLEYGEGFKECVEREMMEEAGIEVTARKLFYLNEDFVPSAFHDRMQVISVYYQLESNAKQDVVTDDPLKLDAGQHSGDQILYWCNLADLAEQDIQLPIDQKVVRLLQENYL